MLQVLSAANPPAENMDNFLIRPLTKAFFLLILLILLQLFAFKVLSCKYTSLKKLS